MHPSVNLDNLRDITGGDAEIECELFQIFLESGAECLQDLASNLGDAQAENWRKAAHAFKGISYNLGAEPLGDLCTIAQNQPHDSAAAKQALLDKLHAEFGRVRAVLSGLLG
jgi:two-component system, sensor histidine kinase and response regulator